MDKKTKKELLNRVSEQGRTDDYPHQTLATCACEAVNELNTELDEISSETDRDDFRTELQEAYVKGFCKGEGYKA